MPRKRQKSSNEIPATNPTWASADAAERFHSSLVGKRCIQERGFKDPEDSIQNIIQQWHWEEFAKQPSAAVVSVIREFYANAKEHKGNKALVRGKWVPFDRGAINKFYQLPNIDQDEYSKYVKQGPNYMDVIRFLTVPGTQWKSSKSRVVHFPLAGLKREGKAWHYFISAKLLPTNNLSEVTKDRAVLNFAIQRGFSIDVGSVIHNSILHTLKGATTGGFGHPSLIYALCLQAGITTSPYEEIQHPRLAITPALIRRFKIRGETSNTETSSSHQQSSPQHHSDHPSSNITKVVTDLQPRLSKLQQTLHKHQQWQHSINHKLDQFAAGQELAFAYAVQFNNALVNLLSNPDINPGTSNVVFPQPPTFPPIAPAHVPNEPIATDDEELND